MGTIRRVTLRCLCEDLGEDWTSTHQKRGFTKLWKALKDGAPNPEILKIITDLPPTLMIGHPLINHFRSAFDSSDTTIKRESISGLTNPLWWKQKTTRWRGAATSFHATSENEEIWLCAGGLRSSGDRKDFYSWFCSSIESQGTERYLPTAADRRYQTIEEKDTRRNAWTEQIRLATLICLHDVDHTKASKSIHIPAPKPGELEDPLVHVTFELTSAEDGVESITELMVHIRFSDLSRPKLAEIAKSAMLSTINPDIDAWSVLPGVGTDEIWAVDITDPVFAQATKAAESGQVPDTSRKYWAPASHAHYTPEKYIVEAQVEGESVRGLCGSWFVPTADPEKLPVCPLCHERFMSLP